MSPPSSMRTRSPLPIDMVTAAIAVPATLVFGIAVGVGNREIRFRGKSVLTTLIDLPFSVSPVIAGLI